MEPRKYRVDIYWSEEDQLYLAEVPELPGCLTHGQTVVDAARNAEEAMEGWLEVAEELGRPIPKPMVERHYSGRFLTRIPQDLHARLALEAERQDVSLNQLVVARLAETLSRLPTGRAPARPPSAPRKRAKAAKASVGAT